jgi:hypothetical protein
VNPGAARQVVQRILHAVGLLAAQPLLDRPEWVGDRDTGTGDHWPMSTAGHYPTDAGTERGARRHHTTMQLYYDVHAGTGPYMLLVHGFLSSRSQWRLNLAALAGVVRPVVVELWGHGRSPAPTDPVP